MEKTRNDARQGQRRESQSPPKSKKGGRRAAPSQKSNRPAPERTRPPVPPKKEEEQPRSASSRRGAAIDAWREEPRPARRRDTPAPESPLQAIGGNLRRVRRRWRRIVREARTSRFPESNRAPIQLILLIWGLLPMWGSLIQEHTWVRKKRTHSTRGGRAPRWRVHPAVFLLMALCIASGGLLVSTYTFGTTVTYDGEVIAALPSQEEAEGVRKDIEQVASATLGESYQIDDKLIQYSSGLLRREDLTDVDEYAQDLSDKVGLVSRAYCLYVDGERVGATPYEGAMEELQHQILSSASNGDTISCSFAEKVEVKEEYVPNEELVNLGYVAETLRSTKEEEVTYEVKKGDTWSEIAEDHGMTSKELLALNPGYNIDKIQIGEILTLSASVPYLTMTLVQRERYVEEVNYDIEFTDDASMWVGDEKVTSKGQFGAADKVANVTYVNGQETERTVLSSVTLRQPVTEYRLRGTKPRPTTMPTGSFRWPTSGRITSRFGYRTATSIYSSNHGGIDIATSYGNPVYAADGGTVTYAGWMGSYGYLVRIQHDGTGFETYYAHNSSILVRVGQKVYKGQQIARIGSTGNSTGPHCHFEVRYNGVRRNPLNYLP